MTMFKLLEQIRRFRDKEIDREMLNHRAEQELLSAGVRTGQASQLCVRESAGFVLIWPEKSLCFFPPSTATADLLFRYHERHPIKL